MGLRPFSPFRSLFLNNSPSKMSIPRSTCRCLTLERPPLPTDDPVARRLFDDDDKSFMRLMSSLLSNSSTERNHNEELLLSLSNNYPELLCLRTMSFLWSPLREVRFHAAILLRQFFTLSSDFHLWPRITPACQNNIKLLLLLALQEEEIRYIAIAKSDTISELASALDDPLFAEYPQLLPYILFTICMGRQQILVEAYLRLFSRIAKKLADILPQRIITLRSILTLCITTLQFSSEVRVAGLLASSSLVQSLPPSRFGPGHIVLFI